MPSAMSVAAPIQDSRAVSPSYSMNGLSVSRLSAIAPADAFGTAFTDNSPKIQPRAVFISMNGGKFKDAQELITATLF